MGTETSPILCEMLILEFSVKLNNPLMGTETLKISSYKYSKSKSCVKLNNPLMGTETYHIH